MLPFSYRPKIDPNNVHYFIGSCVKTEISSSIESLPNEVWLTFMSYLGAIDMFRAFSGLNRRINSLLTDTTLPVVLDTSQSSSNVIHFSDMYQLIENNLLWSKHLRLSLNTVLLHGTHAGDRFLNYTTALNCSLYNMTNLPMLFPSVRRLYVAETTALKYGLVKLIHCISRSLRYLHITLDYYTDRESYFKFLKRLDKHQLSF